MSPLIPWPAVHRAALCVAATAVLLAAGACAPEGPQDACPHRHEAIGSHERALSCSGQPTIPVFSTSIDALASYDPQTNCDPTAKPGAVAFRDLILATYPCTGDFGITRACSSGGTSEHKEGRAWDWKVAVGNQAADDLLAWLLAPDAQGNKYAMARRLGIMYMVWNRKIWGAYRANDGWRTYTGSNPHTDHVHFSFSHAGGDKQTSFWGGTTPAPDTGPPPPPDSGPPPKPDLAPMVDSAQPAADRGLPADLTSPPRDRGAPGTWDFPHAPPSAAPTLLTGSCAVATTSEGSSPLAPLLLLLLIARLAHRRRG